MNMLDKLAKNWKPLTGFAAVVLATVVAFLKNAPGFQRGDASAEKFAGFCIAIIASLACWLVQRHRSRSKGRIVALTVAALVVVALGYVSYRLLIVEWTVTPPGIERPLMLGTSLTPDAMRYSQEHHLETNPLSKADAMILLESMRYNSNEIWQSGVSFRWTVLLALYVLLSSAACVCIVAAVNILPEANAAPK